jgi:hypothetical protein
VDDLTLWERRARCRAALEDWQDDWRGIIEYLSDETMEHISVIIELWLRITRTSSPEQIRLAVEEVIW